MLFQVIWSQFVEDPESKAAMLLYYDALFESRNEKHVDLQNFPTIVAPLPISNEIRRKIIGNCS